MKFGIRFDFPDGVALFAGWLKDGALGFAPTLATAATFDTQEVARSTLQNSYGAGIRRYGTVFEVSE